MLFLGGDPIEAGLAPLKLPRCSLVFTAGNMVFDSLKEERQVTFPLFRKFCYG